MNLFHPRLDRWEDHFALVSDEIQGRTPSGRATVRLLQMNATNRVKLRKWLLATGEFERAE